MRAHGSSFSPAEWLSWFGGEHPAKTGAIAQPFDSCAHYRGDAMLLLPKSDVLFAGDIVFHDRMLGVWPHSPVDHWRNTFRAMEKLPAKIVVPGHGNPGDLAKARHDTGNYLDFLADNVIPAARDWEPLDAVTERLADQPPFKHLQHYDGWHQRNVNQTYIQFEGK